MAPGGHMRAQREQPLQTLGSITKLIRSRQRGPYSGGPARWATYSFPEVSRVESTGVGGRLPQGAERRVADYAGEVLQFVEVFVPAQFPGDPVENLQQAFVSDAAGRALAARPIDGEFEVEFGHRHHAVVFVHYDHSSRAIMEPAASKLSKSIGVSRCFSVRQPPEGPPVCTALNFFPPLIPPPMS